MNARGFLEELESDFDKDMKDSLRLAYLSKIQIIADEYWHRIEQHLVRTCKRFPSIAEIFISAEECGWHERRGDKPHTWEPTDCKLCIGSGLLASFWIQEFTITEDGKRQNLRLHYVMPYHQSGAYSARNDHNDVRYVHRCCCPAGEVPTLPLAVPRWVPDGPSVVRRDWAA